MTPPRVLIELAALLIQILRVVLRSRAELALENLALRQQLTVLETQRPRPPVRAIDRLLWPAPRKAWSGWTRFIIIVQPDTAVRWHREAFRFYWRRISRPRGRPPLDGELRRLIRQMAGDNPSWGAPRIHGELLKLGLSVSERTVSRYLPRRRPNPDTLERSMKFLRNHRHAIAAMDFLVVPTATFRLLYVFFVIEHGRRRIVHFNVTAHPSAPWVIQQLRDAFPHDSAPRYLIYDRDSIFSKDVTATLRSFGAKPVRTSYRSPWQSGTAGRWVGTLRRELLHHVVVFNERHLRRLVHDYLCYYHEDRCHYALGKDTPDGRPTQHRPAGKARVLALPRVGGLHHRYVWRKAA